MQDDLSIIVELVNRYGCDRERDAIERICAAIAEPAVTSTNTNTAMDAILALAKRYADQEALSDKTAAVLLRFAVWAREQHQ